MLQRLSYVSVLSGSVIVASMLLSACSTWGGNPPPRFNQVVGDRRPPVLNPGGNGVVRPADEIAPPTGANIKPANQPVQQRQAPMPGVSSYDPEITPNAAPAATSPFSASPAPSAPTIPSSAYPVPASSPFGYSSGPTSQLTPAQAAPQQRIAFASPESLGQIMPAAGGNATSLEVNSPIIPMADVGSLTSSDATNATSAKWDNIPGGNPLSPPLSAEEKAQANMAAAFANMAPAAGGNAARAATPAMAMVTPSQIQAAQEIITQLSMQTAKKQDDKEAVINDAKNSFAAAKQEETNDALLAASRDRRAPINQASSANQRTAFTYSATPLSGTFDMQLPDANASAPTALINAQSAITLYEAPADDSTVVITAPQEQVSTKSSVIANADNVTVAEATEEVAAVPNALYQPRAHDASESYLPESRYARYRGNFHSYRMSKLSSSSQN